MTKLEQWFFWQHPAQKLIAELVAEKVVKGASYLEQVDRSVVALLQFCPNPGYDKVQKQDVQEMFDTLFSARIQTAIGVLSAQDLHEEVITKTSSFSRKLGLLFFEKGVHEHLSREAAWQKIQKVTVLVLLLSSSPPFF